MSYILDALKKSEYARQQGKVPDLASLPVMDAGASSTSARQRLPLLSAGAVLLAIAAAGWWRPCCRRRPRAGRRCPRDSRSASQSARVRRARQPGHASATRQRRRSGCADNHSRHSRCICRR